MNFSNKNPQSLENFVLSVPKWIDSCEFHRTGEVSVTVPSHSIFEFFSFVQNHTNLRMQMLVDLTAVDFPKRSKRFEVVYHLMSLDFNCRLRVKTHVDETSCLPSICSLYKSSGWFEREVWDLFGIYFLNHPDLRRIMTDYGFEGHPFRKDFPLSGYLEARYDEGEKRVLLESIELAQEFRFFEFSNPWETNNK